MFPKETGIIIEDILFDIKLFRFLDDLPIEFVHGFMALFIEIHGLQHVDRKLPLSDKPDRFTLQLLIDARFFSL